MRSKWNGEPPYREIDFGFVFVRAVRAGEAKLRGRARGKCPAVAEARPDQMSLDRQTVARGVPPVSRRCPALVEARPDQMTLVRQAVPRGVQPVSRRCPVVSRRCPVGVPS